MWCVSVFIARSRSKNQTAAAGLQQRHKKATGFPGPVAFIMRQLRGACASAANGIGAYATLTAEPQAFVSYAVLRTVACGGSCWISRLAYCMGQGESAFALPFPPSVTGCFFSESSYRASN